MAAFTEKQIKTLNRALQCVFSHSVHLQMRPPKKDFMSFMDEAHSVAKTLQSELNAILGTRPKKDEDNS